MLNLTGAAMQNQQARLVTLRRRHLSDQLRRQLIIEVRGSHLAKALCQCAKVTRIQVLQWRGKGGGWEVERRGNGQYPEDGTPKCSFLTTCLSLILAQMRQLLGKFLGLCTRCE